MPSNTYPTLDELQSMSTISIEAAANLIGISRQSGYDAAARGDIPVICIGRRKRVKARPLYAMLTDTEDTLATE